MTVPLAFRWRIGPQFEDLGLQLDRFKQIIDADALFGRGLAVHGLRRPTLPA